MPNVANQFTSLGNQTWMSVVETKESKLQDRFITFFELNDIQGFDRLFLRLKFSHVVPRSDV
jgi:hypothetical protein